MRQEAVFCVLPVRNTDLIFQIFSVTKIKNIKTCPKKRHAQVKTKASNYANFEKPECDPVYEKSCTFLISYIAVKQVQLAKAKSYVKTVSGSFAG